ncbi:hypothetical protein FRB95_008015 [Tulasnella sp. JGI-2019a]|nr:hypothetical protein FRB95_008015 [Tulasnella sp. JGI-2019a]
MAVTNLSLVPARRGRTRSFASCRSLSGARTRTTPFQFSPSSISTITANIARVDMLSTLPPPIAPSLPNSFTEWLASRVKVSEMPPFPSGTYASPMIQFMRRQNWEKQFQEHARNNGPAYIERPMPVSIIWCTPARHPCHGMIDLSLISERTKTWVDTLPDPAFAWFGEFPGEKTLWSIESRPALGEREATLSST